jgi:signal transduction histidine kinase
LDNALKYSNEDGNITISTHEGEREISVKITDQGIGIDPEDIPYVFETFHRGKGVEEKPGFGLGLAGVKAIVESHGGRVSVESEVGKGSVFTVVLPKPESPIQIAWSK